MSDENVSEIRSIDLVPDDLITALGAKLKGSRDYAFVLAGEGDRRFADLQPASRAREGERIDLEPEHFLDEDGVLKDAVSITANGESTEASVRLV